jgi:hypothetical protein
MQCGEFGLGISSKSAKHLVSYMKKIVVSNRKLKESKNDAIPLWQEAFNIW